MKTLDQMISELSALRDSVGGDAQVFFDKNGCDDGPRSITDIEAVGYCMNPDGYWVEDDISEPSEPSDKVIKLVKIYSDRDSLFDNLEENND